MKYTVYFSYNCVLKDIEAGSEAEAERIAWEEIDNIPYRDIGNYLDDICVGGADEVEE